MSDAHSSHGHGHHDLPHFPPAGKSLFPSFLHSLFSPAAFLLPWATVIATSF